MFSTSKDSDLCKNSVKIQQKDKFFSGLLSRENSAGNHSFRVYYGGGAAAVPFIWESHPGTPKCKLSEASLPPLTPPPAYYSHSNSDKNNKPIRRLHLRSNNPLQFLFLKLNGKKNYTVAVSPSSSSISSNSPWSSSSFSTVVPISSSPKKYHRPRSMFSIRGSSFDSRADYKEADSEIGLPHSTLCFGNFRGCYGWQ